MTRLLFYSIDNACRSQIAEAFAKKIAPDGVSVFSAGIIAGKLDHDAIVVMSEIGIDTSSLHTKSLADLNVIDFDLIIALCDQAYADIPVLPGNPPIVNWKLNPTETFSDISGEKFDKYRQIRDEVTSLVSNLFNNGYLDSFIQAKKMPELILNNISDAIIAHDMNRIVFFFNDAAERITGYKREEVINRDCNEVFPDKLCGDQCTFCGENEMNISAGTKAMKIRTKNGGSRFVEMSVSPVFESNDRPIGVIASFHDLTPRYNLAKAETKYDYFPGVVGSDPKMLEVMESIEDVAKSNLPVMIGGASGTGKELVARAIHNRSRRCNKLFVPVNCGALPENLLESELFGHAKGAFTGALRDKKGRFELADGGTIFLDEIGDVSQAMQVKMLRVLQEGTFESVGSERTKKVNVRVVSATNKDIGQEIAEGRFREDLFYRLNVVPIELPSLKHRRGDIPLLADYILKKTLKESGIEKNIVISPEVMDILFVYNWPGNIRELQNWLQFAVIKCKGDIIKPEHLPRFISKEVVESAEVKKKRTRKRKLNRSAVELALKDAGGNKMKAAKILGVGRATLYRFLDLKCEYIK